MPGIGETLHEFKHGDLHSGSAKGPVVKSRKQALAIALSQAGKPKPSYAERMGRLARRGHA